MFLKSLVYESYKYGSHIEMFKCLLFRYPNYMLLHTLIILGLLVLITFFYNNCRRKKDISLTRVIKKVYFVNLV